MDEKGGLYLTCDHRLCNREDNPATPELYKKTNNKENSIWSYGSRGPSFDVGIMCNKVQFISGSIQSFGDVGKIDLLDNQKKIEHGQEAAENLLLFNKALKNQKNNISNMNTKVEEVASKLSNLKQLTNKKYYNAVEQEKESYYISNIRC